LRAGGQDALAAMAIAPFSITRRCGSMVTT
jgi:hypothetical protein